MQCTPQLHNTWLKLEDAVERLRVNRRRLRLDETGNVVVGQEKLDGQIPAPFFDMVDLPDSNGCWKWTGALNRKGYGNISVRGIDIPVHRFVYMMTVGPIPDGLLVCHSCDVRNCVNPHHLFVGTDMDNCRDKIQKSRLRAEKGVERYNAKLNDDRVRQIRAEFTGKHGQIMKFATRYGVSRHVIGSVIRRERWKHVV